MVFYFHSRTVCFNSYNPLQDSLDSGELAVGNGGFGVY